MGEQQMAGHVLLTPGRRVGQDHVVVVTVGDLVESSDLTDRQPHQTLGGAWF
jgi:hypothetical protein